MKTSLRVFSKFIPPNQSISHDDLQTLTEFILTRKPFLITGAGLSTESGIPDYRSPNGSYSKGHKPMEFKEFMASEKSRKRYWARNMNGFRMFVTVQPNIGHYSVAELQKGSFVGGIVTQNVDRLHQKAGATDVIDLHGNNHEVMCMGCRTISSRSDLQDRLVSKNFKFLSDKLDWRSDGDAELTNVDYDEFIVEPCLSCGGILKPNVVFFGENVKPGLPEEIKGKIEMSGGVLAIGSSLQVYSSFRFIRHAHSLGIPVAILNIGPTRGDELATHKFEGVCGEALDLVSRQILQ
jgi:NAD-dependent deacetylase sirtuin 4